MRNVTTLTVAFAFAAAAHAAPPQPLTGVYAFSGKTLIDSPPSEAQDTHFVVTLDGATARDLYRKLKATLRRDACLDDGSMTKRVGDVQCTATAKPKGHVCTFAIDLARRKLAAGAVC
jgi:hypothetical protein